MALTGTCGRHPDQKLVFEPGGHDMPTLRGRTYCPECQAEMMAVLDDQVMDHAHICGQEED